MSRTAIIFLFVFVAYLAISGADSWPKHPNKPSDPSGPHSHHEPNEPNSHNGPNDPTKPNSRSGPDAPNGPNGPNRGPVGLLSSSGVGDNYCGPNEILLLCGPPSHCQSTCKEPNKKCPDKCVGGCVCERGYVRDSNNQCVPFHGCQN